MAFLPSARPASAPSIEAPSSTAGVSMGEGARAGARDRDGDGRMDAEDRCPCVAEDFDSFQDEDGCPELDNDRDRIVDPCDRCPDHPETYNGRDDEDGCPDYSHIVVESVRVEIHAHVLFPAGREEPAPSAAPVLEEVARALRENPQLRRVRLHGHADRGERRPERLALRRAERVRELLVARGIEAARLEVESHGAAQPLDPGRGPESRARNRRVQLEILDLEQARSYTRPPPPPPLCPGGPPPPPTDVCTGRPAVLPAAPPYLEPPAAAEGYSLDPFGSSQYRDQE